MNVLLLSTKGVYIGRERTGILFSARHSHGLPHPHEPFDPAGIKIPRTDRLRAIEHLGRWKTWLLGRAVLYIFLCRSRRRRLYIFTKMYGDRAGGCFVTVITKS